MLIGISGYARSGKDQSYQYINDFFNGVATRLSFAEALKVSAIAALGIDTDDPVEYCNKFKESGLITYSTEFVGSSTITGRQYLQNYGTEAHRDLFGDNFWVDLVLPEDFDHLNEIYVVTDVRFTNEAKRIRDLGGVVWQIDRPSIAPANGHSSEVPLDKEDVDIVVANHGSLEDLRRNVYELLTPSLELTSQTAVETPL